MAILKSKDILKMSLKEIEEKIKDLKMELIKNKIIATKGGKLKIREIKRTIARLITIHRLNQKKESLKKEILKKSRNK
jgi:ribosomal protein L29